jgi:parallel beta-helix repeat protein
MVVIMGYLDKDINMKAALLLAMAALVIIVPRNTHARTWYVKADGSGDAPTIRAGVDSASIGDTVLVGPGTYYGEWAYMKEGVSLISEEGPYFTRIVGGGISCSGFIGNFHSEVNGFWMEGNTGMFGAITLGACYNIDIRNNIFTGNRAGIYICLQGYPYIENNIMVWDF